MALVAAMAAPQGGRWPSRRWQLWQCGRCDGGVVMAAGVVIQVAGEAKEMRQTGTVAGGGEGGGGNCGGNHGGNQGGGDGVGGRRRWRGMVEGDRGWRRMWWWPGGGLVGARGGDGGSKGPCSVENPHGTMPETR